jgi:AraC-like DNA-binding protein
MSSAFTGLLDGLLESHPALLRARYTDHSRLAAGRRFLVDHLRDPALGVASLCEHLDCSRATAYRLFEHDGGVACYIQRQRLHRCLRELTRVSRAPPDFIDKLARSWQLGGAARFRRLCSEEFGIDADQVIDAQQSQYLGDARRRAGHWRAAEAINGHLGRAARAAGVGKGTVIP